MKRFSYILLSLVTLSFFTTAFGQAGNSPTQLPGFDLKLWGSSAGVFALFVVAAVGLIRNHWTQLSAYAIYAVSLVISEVGAAILYYGGWLTDPAYTSYRPPLVWILFGLGAFVVASGGYAALAKLLTRPAAVVAVTVAPVSAAPDSALSAAPALPMGPVQLQPLGTPGTIPLHDLAGNVIGGVLPLPSGLQGPL